MNQDAQDGGNSLCAPVIYNYSMNETYKPGFMTNFPNMYNKDRCDYYKPNMIFPNSTIPPSKPPITNQMENSMPNPNNFTNPILDNNIVTNNDFDYERQRNYVNHPEKKLREFMQLDFQFVISNLEDYIIDQENCKLVQDWLIREPNDDFFEHSFRKIIPEFTYYLKDQFANYFCQKLIERCDQKKLSIIINQIADDILVIANNPHGTRVLQKILEQITDLVLLDRI